MTEVNTEKPKDYTARWNRFAYVAFLLLSAYFLFISKDPRSAVANLGIGLVFDPFNQQLRFDKRPLWQRIWLIVHVALVMFGFGFLLLAK